jgi:hypothetical protein
MVSSPGAAGGLARPAAGGEPVFQITATVSCLMAPAAAGTLSLVMRANLTAPRRPAIECRPAVKTASLAWSPLA